MADIAPGGELGRYVLLRPLLAPGLEAMYLAFDPELDRNVALRLVRPRRSRGVDTADALVAQARALARLSHPNVIQVYDVGRWRDRVYVALEYVEGRSLDAWVGATKPRWRDIVAMLCAAGDGVAAGHQADLLHLAIEPRSIFVGDDGVARLMDLGLARSSVGHTSDGATRTGEARDTAVVASGHVAPELLRGEAPDARSDQFGFCATAWEVLVGAPPFVGSDAQSYALAVARGVSLPPSGNKVPRRVLDVLAVGLADEPASRHPSFGRLLAVLRAAVSPWTTGRRIAATVGVVAVVGGGIGWSMRPAATECRDRPQLTTEVWSAARAEEIRAAFADTNLPYAAHAWSAMRRTLDERVATWERVDLENCLATEVQSARSRTLGEGVDVCLLQRRGEIEALLGVFAEPDAQMVERAAEAAGALRSAATCVREAEAAPPVDEIDRAARAALLARLAEAGALWEAQRYEDVETLANTIVTDARHAGLRAIEAEALALAANAQARMGRVTEAVAGLELAARTADAGGIDDRRVETLVDLVYVAGHLAGDPRAGHWYARVARSVFDRLGDRPSRKANLLLNEGAIYGDEARLEESLAAYAEALEVWRTDAREPDETLAVLLNNVGSTHLLRDDLGAAAAWFMQAHIVRLSLSGPEHPAVADVLVNLGNVFQKLGQGEAALVSYRQALALFERTRGAQSPETRVVLNNLGVVLLDLGRLDEARTVARRTVELYREVGVDTTAEGAVVANLAEVELLLGDAAAARAGYRRAFELVTQTMPASHPYAINAVSGLARASYDLGDDASATAWSRWALGLEDRFETPMEIRAEPRFTLARALARAGADPSLVMGLAHSALEAYEGLGMQAATKAAKVRAFIASQQP